jgi:hypothetical protein
MMNADRGARRASISGSRTRTVALRATALAAALTAWQAGFAEAPSGAYQGWLWTNETSVVPATVREEFCSGGFGLDFTVDSWALDAPAQVCWGRETTTSSRALFNPPQHAGAEFASQSTQPLQSAGGNLFEIYGEEVVADVGQGAERIGTVLAEPSGADLLFIGAHDAADDVSGRRIGQTIDVAVQATPAIVAARTTGDLSGTNWRVAILEHVPSPGIVNAEPHTNTIWSLELGAAGACSFVTSAEFPDFTANGDTFSIRQQSTDGDLSNRETRGGVQGATLSDCTYEIDAEGFLAIAAQRTPAGSSTATALALRYQVSDDAQFLILAPDTDGTAHDPHELTVGYRAADGLTVDALDGDYLFYLVRTDYQSTGTFSTTAEVGPQEFDSRGRGLLRFDSATVGTTPPGESGTWLNCEAGIALDALALGYAGDYVAGTAVAASTLGQGAVAFDACDYQVAADGALRVHVQYTPEGSDTVEATLRGYVNESGEVASLIAVDLDPASPVRGASRLRDQAGVLHVLAMRYSGDVTANEDGDRFSNLEEFQYPLPPPPSYGCSDGPLPVVCSTPDVNGNGSADLLTVRPDALHAEIRDSNGGALIGTLAFLSSAYTPAAAAVLPDTDDDGIAELAVLAARNSDHRMVVQIRNLDGSGTPRQVFFATGYTPLALEVIGDDTDSDGVPELAVLSARISDGRGAIEVKNAAGEPNAKVFMAPIGFVPHDVEIVRDADGNGVPDIALLATRTSDGRILGQVRNADGLGAPYSTWFAAAGQTAVDLAVVPDKDADGIPELAVLSARTGDGKLLVQVKNASGAFNPYAFWLPTGYTGIELAAVAPADGSAIPEIAVLQQRNSDGRILVSVRNAVGTDSLRSIWYTTGYTARGLAVFPDADGNGIEEPAALMTRNSDGRIVVQSRNAFDAQAPQSYFFAP